MLEHMHKFREGPIHNLGANQILNETEGEAQDKIEHILTINHNIFVCGQLEIKPKWMEIAVWGIC